MTLSVTFPGHLRVRAAHVHDQATSPVPDWGVYADECWSGWPGVVLDWRESGVPADDEVALSAIVQTIGRAREGQDVLVGGDGSFGCTGIVLAAIAIGSGIPPEHASAWVRRRYPEADVETGQQRAWLIETVARDRRLAQLGEKARSSQVESIRQQLRHEMEEAGSARDPLPVLAWALPGELAITQRPLRAHPTYGGSRRDFPLEARPAIDAWIEDLIRQGIHSLIVLTSNKELAHYDAPTRDDGGLLQLYRDAGLEVEHMPADDPAHDVTAAQKFDAAVDDIAGDVAARLVRLQSPTVMHCSAAIDRSPPVAARVAFLAQLTRL